MCVCWGKAMCLLLKSGHDRIKRPKLGCSKWREGLILNSLCDSTRKPLPSTPQSKPGIKRVHSNQHHATKKGRGGGLLAWMLRPLPSNSPGFHGSSLKDLADSCSTTQLSWEHPPFFRVLRRKVDDLCHLPYQLVPLKRKPRLRS